MKSLIKILILTLSYLVSSEGVSVFMRDNVDFICYNRTGQHIYAVFPGDRKLNSKINRLVDSVFIIHGWQSSFYDEEWMLNTVKDFVTYVPEINVCAISWGVLANDGYLDAATDHVYSVAKFIARIFNIWNLNPEKITMVGHSLGAHISGHVGLLFGGKLKAIYGLDPAYPFFCEGDPAPINKRLDRTDAKYVQVILTSKGITGCDDHSAHQTFYPDGGTHPQPACSIANTICSHGICQEYFRMSLNPAIVYEAKQCVDWDTYKDGDCDSNVSANMGFYADQSIEGEFFLYVSDTEPYVA